MRVREQESREKERERECVGDRALLEERDNIVNKIDH
jgi:hypothetical protein